MRMKGYLRRVITLGLLLILGLSFTASGVSHTVLADEVQEAKLNVNSQAIVKGKTFSLYVYNLGEEQTALFRSSAPAIASVDENGLITANAVGTTTVTVTIKESDKTITELVCEVTVGPPAISVQFSRLELSMTVGQKLTLERIVQPLNTVESPRFSSYDLSIATVSAGGRVTAKTEGSTYIFAQIGNGRFAVCKVYIYPEGTILEEEGDATGTDDATDTLESTPDVNALFEGDDAGEAEEEIEVKDPLLKNTGVDFEAFLKKLNAAGNTANDTEAGVETTN